MVKIIKNKNFVLLESWISKKEKKRANCTKSMLHIMIIVGYISFEGRLGLLLLAVMIFVGF